MKSIKEGKIVIKRRRSSKKSAHALVLHMYRATHRHHAQLLFRSYAMITPRRTCVDVWNRS